VSSSSITGAHRRSEFNWLLHFVFPVGTSIILVYSLVKSFTPFPGGSVNWSPAIVGGWLVLGVVVLFVMHARGDEDWMKRAGEIVGERRERPDELEHLHRERI
jgi:membrane associated rhomboid family serine protease